MAVAAVFHTDRIQRLPYGRVRLMTEHFGLKHCLCPCERDYGQEAGAYATAFLVAPNLIVTAAHVLAHLDRRVFVFGFQVQEGVARVELAAAQVHEAAEVVGMTLDTVTGADWAVVRLGRPLAPDVPIPRIRRQGRVSDGQALYVIAHPGGLPTKYTEGGCVRRNEDRSFFAADLDARWHCSGAPVFNADDHAIEGLVVRGSGGIGTGEGCERCSKSDEPGRARHYEDCVRTTLFSHLLP